MCIVFIITFFLNSTIEPEIVLSCFLPLNPLFRSLSCLQIYFIILMRIVTYVFKTSIGRTYVCLPTLWSQLYHDNTGHYRHHGDKQYSFWEMCFSLRETIGPMHLNWKSVFSCRACSTYHQIHLGYWFSWYQGIAVVS